MTADRGLDDLGRPHNVWALDRELLAAGVPDNLAAVAADMVRCYRRLDEDLATAADELAARMVEVGVAVRSGRHVNPLGEVQGSGPKVDLLCARRQDSAEGVMRIRHAVLGSAGEAARDLIDLYALGRRSDGAL